MKSSGYRQLCKYYRWSGHIAVLLYNDINDQDIRNHMYKFIGKYRSISNCFINFLILL
jgi:hypothetical protein